MAIVIGLTGNIGTGKSTVLRMLAELGAHTIDADQVAHEAIAPGGAAYRGVIEAFGPDILREDGSVDRRKLAEIVFSDPAKLARLEAIVHPAVYTLLKRRIACIEARVDPDGPEPVIVIEAIKLLEAGLSRSLCDQVWVVTAPLERQLDRLMRGRGVTKEEALRRLASQSPQEEKVRQADVVIDNSGSLERTAAQVRKAWETHVEPLRRQNTGERS
ncbi:MAG TPA: dephospho-CoA kinase [Caldilineae bacterium]|nr:dephospho-CoA kinase [Caldilineae bacterium]